MRNLGLFLAILKRYNDGKYMHKVITKKLNIRLASGFTLVEIMVTMVIIGILSGVSIVGYGSWKESTITAQLKSDLNGAVAAMDNARNFGNGYPTAIPTTFKPSSGVTLKGGGLPGGKGFCITATNGNLSYSIDQDKKPLAGGRNLLIGNTALEKTSANEFLQYADLAPIFDVCGTIQYTISFDIKSANIANQSTMRVYMQNGSAYRYYFEASIPVSTTYTRRSVTVKPVLSNTSEVNSILAFYGTYGTGNKPSVKNVKVEFGSSASAWTLAP